MANSAQAKKRARQAENHRLHNASQRSTMRTYVKNVLKSLQEADKDGAKGAYKMASSLLDKAAQKGLIHANKAARYKKRLNARIKAA